MSKATAGRNPRAVKIDLKLHRSKIRAVKYLANRPVHLLSLCAVDQGCVVREVKGKLT